MHIYAGKEKRVLLALFEADKLVLTLQTNYFLIWSTVCSSAYLRSWYSVLLYIYYDWIPLP